MDSKPFSHSIKSKMKQLKFSIIAVLLIVSAQTFAQSSFKRLPIPEHRSALSPQGITQSNEITAFRFTPFGGYNVFTKQVVAGLGYGWNKLHFVDSIQRYYTDFSIMGVIYAGGNTTPSLYNVASIGISIGLLNQLIIVGPCYTLPTDGQKNGTFGAVVSLGVPLN